MHARRAITAVILLAGTVLTLAQTPTAPQPPEQIQFEAPRLVTEWDESLEYSLEFPSAAPSGVPANDRVPMRLLLPKEGTRPLPVVVILHYWGASDRRAERQLAFELNKRGVAAALMTLPYHLGRTPEGARSGDLAIVPDPEKLSVTLHQSLQDTRRAIDFLKGHEWFADMPIGISGLSLGGIVAALVYGVDDRLANAAFVLGGVDLAHILWRSSRVVSQREALRKQGFTEESLRQHFAPLEPQRFLEARDEGKSLVIGARYDSVIPPRSTELLIEGLKDPFVVWLETGHYGGVFVQKRLLQEVAAFFGAQMNGLAYTPARGLGAPTLRLAVQYVADAGLDIGAGIDLASTGGKRPLTATGLLTPRGVQMFLGTKLDASLAFGVSIQNKGISVGLLWSRVL